RHPAAALQAAVVRAVVVLRRRRGRPVGLLLPRRDAGELSADHVDLLPRRDHRRRHGNDPRRYPRRGLHDDGARIAQVAGRLAAARRQRGRDPLARAHDRVRRADRRVPDLRTARARGDLAARAPLLPPLPVPYLSVPDARSPIAHRSTKPDKEDDMKHQNPRVQTRRQLMAALATVPGLALAPTAHAQAEDIVIGGSIPMTGVFAFAGIGIHAGIQDYVKIVNDAGGIKGRKLRYVPEDTGYKVDASV